MFFIGVFGIENKQKIIKTIDNIQCRYCNMSTNGKLIKEYDYFHFFFIPLFKWNESYYVVCNNCNSIYSIPKEKGKAVENGEDIQITYWDLKEAHSPYDNNFYGGSTICTRCGKAVEADFDFCPYCGEKINK